MNSFDFSTLFRKFARMSYGVAGACLAAGIILSLMMTPASAAVSADADTPGAGTPAVSDEVCSPPGDWDQTVRLFYTKKTSMEWHFEVDEPEMDVELEWFWYQDYDDYGCPFDCTTGKCQSVEIGEGESPFGTFIVEDGKLGADGGKERQSGRLTQGTYTASFHVTGHGSINIGLKVHRSSVPTNTPVPTDTNTPMPTATPADTSTPAPSETPAATETPNETPLTPSPTFTQTTPGTPQPPVPTSTGTPVIEPPEPSATPSVTPPTETSVPIPTATQVSTEEPPEPTKVSTLPPPEPPSGATSVPKLIPVTGAGLRHGGLSLPEIYQRILLNIGIGLLGLGLLFHGLGNHLGKK